jgi:hypothetical protein
VRDPGRDRHGHGPVPYRRAPGLLGQAPPPAVKESAGKKKGKDTTGHGNRYLARVLGNAAASIARTGTFLGERYRRIARRRGSQKAVVAIGRSLLVIIWHLLADHTTRYTEL